MALTRTQSEYYFTSGGGSQVYTFVISVTASGHVFVRDIRTPVGYLVNSMSSLPGSVVDDITTAISQVENLIMNTSAINGQATFTNQTQVIVSFPTPVANANYRVLFSVGDFVIVRFVPPLTVNGFTIETSTAFTGTVGYDVLF